MKYDQWDILNRYPGDPVSDILKKRGVKNSAEFFSPDYCDLPNSSDFPGLKKAVELILGCRKNGESVGIFMDYDADGICGGSIIFKALEILKIKAIPYIPKREEGYGLSISAVDHFIETGVKLVICVDCGIRNNKEISHAKKNSLKTIVVDHHQLGDILPDADALVHPLISKNNKLKFREYSGGGVAYMLSRELLGQNGREKWLLDLAAISSIADVVPIREANRIIIKFGLLVLKKTKNKGLKKMIELSNIKLESIGTYEVGFMIAPRINAAGRVSNPRRSFELLTSDDPGLISEAAQDLECLNKERQKILEETQVEAVKKVQKEKLYQNKIIVLRGKGWNEGIVGLVASRIVEKFYRPTIVLSEKKDQIKGSARSISGVNIHELIGLSEKHLVSFGGHSQAAGLSVKKDSYDRFVVDILKNASRLDDRLFTRSLKIDALLRPKQITFSLAEQLQKMEPFGPSNPRPVFSFEDVRVEGLRKIGKDQNHRRFSVCTGVDKKYCVAFKVEENSFDIVSGDTVDLAFTLKKSHWQEKEKIDLIVEDVKKK